MSERFCVKLNPMWGWYYVFDNELSAVICTKTFSYEDACDLAIELNKTHTRDTGN